MNEIETSITIALESPSSSGVDELLHLGTQSARELYPPQNSFLLDADELARDHVRVFVARARNNGALAMAALVQGDAAAGTSGLDAELKRMFVRPEARRLGLAARLLTVVEADALGRGVRRIVLETGTLSEAAISLYERCGYQRIPPFGQYVGEPFSVCFAKELEGTTVSA